MTSTQLNSLHLRSVERTERAPVSTVTIQGDSIPGLPGEAIPVEHLLAFTYQQGRAIVLNPQEVSPPGGS